MATRSNSKMAKLEASLRSARSRAKQTKSDPMQETAFAAAGGAGVALMADNNLKLPIPGVPNSLQVAVTALIVNKMLKPKGLAKDLVTGVQNGGAAIWGYGLAKKWGDNTYTVEGDHDQIGSDYISGNSDNLTEG